MVPLVPKLVKKHTYCALFTSDAGHTEYITEYIIASSFEEAFRLLKIRFPKDNLQQITETVYHPHVEV